ncbi:ARO80 [Candida pseudojiufengensis]|uniref:ARO80 n=1 Tax=Candida pseudojiufengensis TaxID=497109 RepID=UPI002225A2D3|nr:ARO80 [Candida pseudojiufengensis]KAI5961187.1 ARO80 [Candida pseudojiufengensis]
MSTTETTPSDQQSKYKRNYRACLNCRVRKVKCDLGPVDNPHDGKCARCLRERKDCIFVESKRGGSNNVMNGKKKKQKLEENVELPGVNSILQENQNNLSHLQPNQSSQLPPPFVHRQQRQQLQRQPQQHHSNFQSPSQSQSPPPQLPPPQQKEKNNFSTMEGALVFLASAAGTFAKADERDHIDARTKYNEIESMTEKQRNETIPQYIKPTGKRMTMPAAENGSSVRPKASTRLANIDYIGENGILTESEAENLINLFFTTMHPFFPHIPKFLHSSKVLAGYPILLCAILTISSRYHPFENNNTNTAVPRNIEVHDRLWLYVQRLISQTVWAEASTRSIGTIFAFLLFTEWNPRAIHWRWSDYANKAEEGAEAPVNGSLAGLGAMRRSHRMAWMLIGSAVRLAQDMGFMEISSKTLIATHIAEINSVMDISRRSMLAHSLSELDLNEDEIEEDIDEEIDFISEEELKKILVEYKIKFTTAQKAQIELLQIMSLGHETFYGYKAQLGHLSQRQNLSVLNIISPLINNWSRKYKQYLIPTTGKLSKHINQWSKLSPKIISEINESIQQESFIFEFNYVKLYIYSLALSPSPTLEKKNLKLDELSKSARFIEQAFNAANEMLNAAHRIHKFKMLRFMPVRWLTRLVRAVAFIVKCYLTITAQHKTSNFSTKVGSIFQSMSNNEIYDPTVLSFSMISVDDISSSIHRAALTLRDCSPDELHLCTRYSSILMYLYSEMKSKKNESEEVEEQIQSQPHQQKQFYDQNQFTKQNPTQQQEKQGQTSHQSSQSQPQQHLPGSSNIEKSLPDTFPYGPYFKHPSNIPTAATLATQEYQQPLSQQQPTQSHQQSPSQQYINSEESMNNMYYNNTNTTTANNANVNSGGTGGGAGGITGGDSEVMDWFINNQNIGLDFVAPWTEMIEQQLNLNDQF